MENQRDSVLVSKQWCKGNVFIRWSGVLVRAAEDSSVPGACGRQSTQAHGVEQDQQASRRASSMTREPLGSRGLWAAAFHCSGCGDRCDPDTLNQKTGYILPEKQKWFSKPVEIG